MREFLFMDGKEGYRFFFFLEYIIELIRCIKMDRDSVNSLFGFYKKRFMYFGMLNKFIFFYYV